MVGNARTVDDEVHSRPQQASPSFGLGVRGDTFALAFNGLVGVRLIVESPDADLDDALADLRLCFERVTGAKLSDGPTDAKGGAIRVRRIDAPDGWPHPEAYHLVTRT
jgi:hypothetical protein